MISRIISRTGSGNGSHHDYVGLVGLNPTAAHALTATLTTVCRSERPTEFMRRDRLDWYPLCRNCHPTRVQPDDPRATIIPPAPPVPAASIFGWRRWRIILGGVAVWTAWITATIAGLT